MTDKPNSRWSRARARRTPRDPLTAALWSAFTPCAFVALESVPCSL